LSIIKIPKKIPKHPKPEAEKSVKTNRIFRGFRKKESPRKKKVTSGELTNNRKSPSPALPDKYRHPSDTSKKEI